MGTKLLYIFILLSTLSACGRKPDYIADEVKFRVNFSEGSVQMIVEMNSVYSLPIQQEEIFEGIGKTEISFDEELQISLLQSKLYASRVDHFPQDPELSFLKFPDDSSFETSEKKNLISILYPKPDIFRTNSTLALIFPRNDYLDFGGGLEHIDFSILPQKARATQVFKNNRGQVVASIVVLGPKDNFTGGIFFFAHLGFNPFPSSSSEDFQIQNSNETFDFSYPATEKAHYDYGEGSSLWAQWKLYQAWLKLRESWGI